MCRLRAVSPSSRSDAHRAPTHSIRPLLRSGLISSSPPRHATPLHSTRAGTLPLSVEHRTAEAQTNMAAMSESTVEFATSVEVLETDVKKPSPCSVSNANFAVLICSAFVGGYSLFLDAVYRELYFYNEIRTELFISSIFKQLSGVLNLALVLALLADENKLTKYALGKAKFVIGVFALGSLHTIIMTLSDCVIITFWELPRFASLLIQLRFTKRRLLQLKEEMVNPHQPIHGWLKSNLGNLDPSALKDANNIAKVHRKNEKDSVHEPLASVL